MAMSSRDLMDGMDKHGRNGPREPPCFDNNLSMFVHSVHICPFRP